MASREFSNNDWQRFSVSFKKDSAHVWRGDDISYLIHGEYKHNMLMLIIDNGINGSITF
jgi:hypothetical protein